ncbi:MAG TPA: pyridoxine 5'-phosphate oxidase C-terminal domain-containing protein [Gaiellaceae bacterium]|nr:pyridoxine 5'-phosphate oxidase C-terminal domain-containing protein [Gaiellaceae bacterium]
MDEQDLDDDAIAQLEAWLAEAREAVPQADSMTLATADRDGRPSARVALLRGVDAGGLCSSRIGRRGSRSGAATAFLPERVEFWIHRESRLHDRIRYVRWGEGWRHERLTP